MIDLYSYSFDVFKGKRDVECNEISSRIREEFFLIVCLVKISKK